MVLIDIIDEESRNRKKLTCTKDGSIAASLIARTFHMCIEDVGLLVEEDIDECRTRSCVVAPDRIGVVSLPWKVWLRRASTRVYAIGERATKCGTHADRTDAEPGDGAATWREQPRRRDGNPRMSLTPHEQDEADCPPWFRRMAFRHVQDGIALAAAAHAFLRRSTTPKEYDTNWRARHNWKRRMESWRLSANKYEVSLKFNIQN